MIHLKFVLAENTGEKKLNKLESKIEESQNSTMQLQQEIKKAQKEQMIKEKQLKKITIDNEYEEKIIYLINTLRQLKHHTKVILNKIDLTTNNNTKLKDYCDELNGKHERLKSEREKNPIPKPIPKIIPTLKIPKDPTGVREEYAKLKNERRKNDLEYKTDEGEILNNLNDLKNQLSNITYEKRRITMMMKKLIKTGTHSSTSNENYTSDAKRKAFAIRRMKFNNSKFNNGNQSVNNSISNSVSYYNILDKL